MSSSPLPNPHGPGAAQPLAQRYGWVAAVAGFVTYEAALHHAAHQPGAEITALLLGAAPFLLLAITAARHPAWRVPALLAVALAAAALWTWRAPLALHFGWTYFLQHFGMNAALAAMFGRTLRRGHTPLCSQFAAAVRGPLSPELQRYTRRVTQAWTLFFALTAAVSAVLFAAAPMTTWSNFANLGTPVLVALMFVAESACRRLAMPGMAHAGVLEAVRGYRAVMEKRAEQAGLLR